MTRKQKQLVGKWMIAVSVVAIIVYFDNWILAHWDALRWPVFLVIVIAAGARRKPLVKPGFARIAESHPWIRLWYALMGAGIAVLAVSTVFFEFRIMEHVGNRVLMLGILAVIAPILVVTEYEKYKAAT